MYLHLLYMFFTTCFTFTVSPRFLPPLLLSVDPFVLVESAVRHLAITSHSSAPIFVTIFAPFSGRKWPPEPLSFIGLKLELFLLIFYEINFSHFLQWCFHFIVNWTIKLISSLFSSSHSEEIYLLTWCLLRTKLTIYSKFFHSCIPLTDGFDCAS